MALDFGKLEFSVSFNPTSAFPLDARSYFESLASAQAAAASAATVGSADSAYYIGQTLVVVENNEATFYMIQPNKTLLAIGDRIKVNTKLFEYDDKGNLSLKGFDEASVNAMLTKGVDGSLSWKVPVDAYSKTETDTKIREAIAAATHMKRVVVDSIEDIDVNAADAEYYIYMVPTGFKETDDRYDEYMVIILVDDAGIETRFVEKIGSWEVNLEDYAKKSDLDNKVDKVANARLITQDEINKLLGIEAGAQKNFINNITTDFIVKNGELQLQNLNISRINGLQESLDAKVNAIAGHILLSPSDKEKLDKLVIGDDSQLEISGTVNAANVKGLADWITNQANSLKGLSEENFTSELKIGLEDILENILFIRSVDNQELSIDNSGKLSIVQVDSSKITGLQEALNSKANQDTVDTISTKVNSIADQLTNFVLKSQHEKDIAELWDVLTWKDIQ